MSAALDLLLVATCCVHVLIAPYSKVEESFNLHAVHDVLMYGVRPWTLHNFDHFVFPGAVPRTFIGSVLLSWLSTPVIKLLSLLGYITSKFDLQIVARLILAVSNASIFCLLRRAISRRYGVTTSALFALLTCTQFHLPFWVGRTLPNMFALFPANISLYLLINRGPKSVRPPAANVHRAIALLVFTAVVFRSEVALLLGPVVLQVLISGFTTFGNMIKVSLLSGLASIALTTVVDSYFWQQWPLWPELHGIYFNVVLGKSSDWGVSAVHTYFTSYLPKLLLSSLPLSVVGLIVDARIRSLLFPPLAFISLLSALGHKEWRFIVYVVPFFNIAAARGATWLISRKKSTLFGTLCRLAVVGLLALNCVATLLLTRASAANYPGGDALAQFNTMYAARESVHVHISNLAAQTGASLFLQVHAPPYPAHLGIAPPKSRDWTYNKTENLSPATLTASTQVTHVIAEYDRQARSATRTRFPARRWAVKRMVRGFEGWKLHLDTLRRPWKALSLTDIGRRVINLLEMQESDKLVILEKTDDN